MSAKERLHSYMYSNGTRPLTKKEAKQFLQWLRQDTQRCEKIFGCIITEATVNGQKRLCEVIPP